MKLIKFTSTIIIIAMQASAYGSDADCLGPSDSTHVQACRHMNNFNKMDKELNKRYRAVIDDYKKQGMDKEVKLLVEAQRLWIRYRDKVCEFENMAFGGVESISWVTCVERLTSQRLGDLKEYVGEFN